MNIRDNSEQAIRTRYREAMQATMKLSIADKRILFPALTDVLVLLREVYIMMPIADELGKMAISNALLSEDNKMMQDLIHEMEYEQRVTQYSGA